MWCVPISQSFGHRISALGEYTRMSVEFTVACPIRWEHALLLAGFNLGRHLETADMLV